MSLLDDGPVDGLAFQRKGGDAVECRQVATQQLDGTVLRPA
jgi:hypothetical protein